MTRVSDKSAKRWRSFTIAAAGGRSAFRRFSRWIMIRSGRSRRRAKKSIASHLIWTCRAGEFGDGAEITESGKAANHCEAHPMQNIAVRKVKDLDPPAKRWFASVFGRELHDDEEISVSVFPA